ncbi:MAG: ribosomal RNA small subunit methyltransferase A [Phycisphaerales bacterium]|nr:ribosomal RNA small subunit methyltransferase A [Phycisphaerales bacterium]
MHTLTELRALLDTHGLAPRKSLGQNFLIDANLARKLVEASAVGAGDAVLEVGPGAGALTETLLELGCRVIACEMDAGLCALLRERFGGRITLIEGDCLAGKHKLNPAIVQAVGESPFRLVANLPYNAATPLMTLLLLETPNCSGMFVTIQKEVADRLGAGPGSKDYGPLSVIVGAFASVRRIALAPPECFWPRPQVTSAMVAVERRPDPLTDDPSALEAVTQRAFQQRRKMLGSSLGRGFPWPDPEMAAQRPEELSPAQFAALAQAARRAGLVDAI